ncbi:hypothetical protein [Spirosoma sp. KUDC1026]|uniref:hypothetical protein n=1 Tax=Spirosoma sp. KUDC1026 TaxID=2745947 RepID=UPI00159BBC80|nr:hypothetical protein [Spirosoma sp. KUDC1026]QKZ13909.1 hypothetical protein HU175_15215 [Spirosoma sp. KUDC1026]
MSETNLYSNLHQLRWTTQCYWAALLNGGIWLLVLGGLFQAVRADTLPDYFAFCLLPFSLLTMPLAAILLLITLRSRKHWPDPRKRFVTLFCTGSMLVSFLAVLTM